MDKKTPSRKLMAVNGPTNEIGSLQTDLSVILSQILRKRNEITNFLGSDLEEEIEKICSLFTAMNRRAVSQRLLNAYCHNRCPIPENALPIEIVTSDTKKD